MSNQMTENGASEAAAPVEQPGSKFSWLQPHPIFAIILVGPEEHPFGIQKDFLCARSEFYRNYFAERENDTTVEHILRLPSVPKEIFGLAQNFMYTGTIITDPENVPSYESLVGLWKLGHTLGVDGLCDGTLDAMVECRRLTQRIPATPLLIQVWKDTPEGSSIRILLLSWAAEYMRSSDARAEFAKSLPQEVLSELVVAMSSFDSVPVVQAPVDAETPIPASEPRKNVHYLDDLSDDEAHKAAKRGRQSLGAAGLPEGAVDGSKQLLGRKVARHSLPKVTKRKTSAAHLDSRNFTTAQKLDFCADLLQRMLSGPDKVLIFTAGFWTRLVGPFKEPVEPAEDGVPDYLEKVKRPMDLGTIKVKMDNKEYATEEEFTKDVRQIFDNCFTYWKKGDPMWAAGEKLQKTFEEKYSGMNKWISKMGGDEGE
ncbi:hypothetical protein S40288_04016 [Stachybotrys chartarum IBT 40288]|nr:hypothetical protein S40288_04016 [Stachybotrys chartarum IBT 40288]